MIQGNQVRRGMVIMHNNEPCLVLDHQLRAQGRQGGLNQTKLKGLLSGSITNVRFNAAEKVEPADVSYKTMQYIFVDGDNAVFMDLETYEQISIPVENIPMETAFLKEEEKYIVQFYEGKVISVQLPKKITLKVTNAPQAVKGDTANNPQKEVIVETGYKLLAPMFIKEGDLIEINTETGLYSGKA
ncbi:MAG: elongation factor P [Candidatus Dojkabacteria bacterium]|nr:MAG: elongation factor P [Candidatus Dojkabacteria bacterium]